MSGVPIADSAWHQNPSPYSDGAGPHFRLRDAARAWFHTIGGDFHDLEEAGQVDHGALIKAFGAKIPEPWVDNSGYRGIIANVPADVWNGAHHCGDWRCHKTPYTMSVHSPRLPKQCRDDFLVCITLVLRARFVYASEKMKGTCQISR